MHLQKMLNNQNSFVDNIQTEKLYKLENSKKTRRKSCTNEMFGGINFFELKNYNVDAPNRIREAILNSNIKEKRKT
jgi:hypothetical protein